MTTRVMSFSTAVGPSQEPNKDGQPLYLQIAHVLGEELRAQQHPVGRLSEQALSARFRVNRHTLRRAIDILVSAGLVERRAGVGVNILPGAIDYRLGPATRFSLMIEESGHSPFTRIISKQVTNADAEMARKLRLSQSAAVVRIDTVRDVDGRPFCVQSQFLDHETFPLVASEYGGGSLHDFLRDRCGVTVSRRGSTISTELPLPADATLLHIGPSQPVIRVSSVNADVASNLPVEFCVTRFRGDRIELQVEFPGQP
ncbi:transcriptional regulator, GntR family [Bradyrhizobium canariense]|uniref:Transcriptional regulator, GntR family n=2 Tax=Bradyrhizobium canariense TaxID=255045 RepID=A0A1H2B4G1_9BRAD|nr:transcriptional regulator, GntR family [Bradyrhizobium canariense]